MHSPAFADPFEQHNTDVEESIELSQEELLGAGSTSLVYAGYSFDPYA